VPSYPLNGPHVLAFVVIPVLLVVALLWGVWAASRRLGEPAALRVRLVGITAVAAAIWMALTWTLAATGVLRRWDATPPPFVLLVVGIVLIAVRISLTGYGRRLALGLPLWTLVAVQAFRFPLELAMHRLYERGIMPGQMSYSGRNFDVLTGITAIVVALLVQRGLAGTRLVLAWNIVGLALLINVVTVAILSTPLFRYFGDDRLNVFVSYPPFVWLPAVMVLSALAGHLLIFRALRSI
jgi:hypothetical protein